MKRILLFLIVVFAMFFGLSACRLVSATPEAEVSATATATPIVATLPITTPKAEVPTVTAVEEVSHNYFQPGWDISWYMSPFRDTHKRLEEDPLTWETFAEPGVLLDATASFDHMSAPDTPILVPEAGYAYVSIGAVTLNYKATMIKLDYQEGNVYLVVIRGIPDDATPQDLNQVVLATDYVRSAGIYSPMPVGAYVSLDWFLQQVQASRRAPNCGADGCRQATVVLVDLETRTFRQWIVPSEASPDDWRRLRN